jgi:hypothetical protein
MNARPFIVLFLISLVIIIVSAAVIGIYLYYKGAEPTPSPTPDSKEAHAQFETGVPEPFLVFKPKQTQTLFYDQATASELISRLKSPSLIPTYANPTVLNANFNTVNPDKSPNWCIAGYTSAPYNGADTIVANYIMPYPSDGTCIQGIKSFPINATTGLPIGSDVAVKGYVLYGYKPKKEFLETLLPEGFTVAPYNARTGVWSINEI